MFRDFELALTDGAEMEEQEEAAVLSTFRVPNLPPRGNPGVAAAVRAPTSAPVLPARSHQGAAVILRRFDWDQSALSDFHFSLIERVARFVVANAAHSRVVRGIRIVGHSDRAGDPAHNLRLAERRAAASQHAVQSAIEHLWPGLNQRIQYAVESRPSSQAAPRDPLARNAASNHRVEVFLSFGPSDVPARYPAITPHPHLKYAWSREESALAIVQREGEASQELKLNGDALRAVSSDGYFAVASTNEPPNRWICRLEIDFGPDPAPPDVASQSKRIILRATGLLISPRHVLTSAHCLLSRSRLHPLARGTPAGTITEYLPIKACSVAVIPGGHGSAAQPFGRVAVAESRFLRKSEEWEASRAANEDCDFALITLDRRFASDPGFWGGPGHRIAALSDPLLKNAVIRTAGYPAEKGLPLVPANPSADADAGKTQWSTLGVVTSVAARTLTHDLPSQHGQSGSPIWSEHGKEKVLVAIHSGASSAPRAVRITAELLNQLRDWMAADRLRPSF